MRNVHDLVEANFLEIDFSDVNIFKPYFLELRKSDVNDE